MFKREVQEIKQGSASLPERLAEALKTSASAEMIYGEPVERDGVTIIPVAKLRYGFGGGGGRHKGEEGSGGGGGVLIQPAGYIELRDGSSRFRVIRSPATFAPLVIAGGLAGFWLFRGLYKMLGRKEGAQVEPRGCE